jgi:hypothetical protein
MRPPLITGRECVVRVLRTCVRSVLTLLLGDGWWFGYVRVFKGCFSEV